MKQNKDKIAGREVKTVTKLAIAVNIALFVIKLLVGLLTGSMSLVADGIHSLSDMFTDLTVMLGVHISLKKPDAEHQYGHGRAETFAAGSVTLLLIFVGIAMIYYAAIAIAENKVVRPSMNVLAVAVISIVLKELLYRITKKAAIKLHSPALYANAWHQRSDALSSVAVAIGFVCLQLGFGYADHIAAIAIGLMIILVAVKLLGDCFSELAERSADPATMEHIKHIIDSDNSIHQWHKLRTRTVGRQVFLDLHILVDPALDITSAHHISENLEKSLSEQIVRPVNITVHIEPDLPEQRK